MLQYDADSAAARGRARLPAQRQRGVRRAASRLVRGLGREDRAALGIWAAAHAGLLVLVWAAAWAFRSTLAHAPLTGGFEHWDAVLLRNIAQYGYFGPRSVPNNTAFFPGYPLILSATHLLVRNWVLSELTVSAVAGSFAVVALARLARHRRAVLYLVTAPAAIFLMVGYSEALFLALAIPAWLAASRGRWWRAALLAGLAGLVRPDGVFLIPALVVMALAGRYRSDRPDEPDAEAALSGKRAPVRQRLANAATACVAVAGPAAYEIYLRTQTGSWTAWSRALRTGWDLRMSTPAQALRTTWWAAFRHPFSASTSFEFQVELGVMAVMIIAALAFASWRRWPEAVYCGLAVVALSTSTWYQTCPRTLLVLFPIWAALAGLTARRPWIGGAYLAVSAPIAVVLGMLYLSGQWAG
jgi:hypothetical protein